MKTLQTLSQSTLGLLLCVAAGGVFAWPAGAIPRVAMELEALAADS